MIGTERLKRREEKVRKAVEGSFATVLKDCFGDNLLSVLAYGSYAGGNFVPGVSDVNLLVILERPAPGQLEAFGKRGRRPMRRLSVTPLILTEAEFLSSADVFPMEYMDIQTRHRVLVGKDVTAALPLQKKNLRHQLEDRLRGAVAALRKLIIAAGGRERLLGKFLKMWFGPFNALLRGLLHLKDVSSPPAESEAVLEKIKEVFALDTGPFTELMMFRKGERLSARRLANSILATLEGLISTVDRMQV